MHEPRALVNAREATEQRKRERMEVFAQQEKEWRRGVNCPHPSIVDSRRVIDLGHMGKFDAIIITKEGDTENAFRYVGALSPENGFRLEPLSDELSYVEDTKRLRFMPGVVLNGNETFHPLNFDTNTPIQQGGLVFETQEQATRKIGVWEELQGDGQGRFHMMRRLPVV